MNSDANAKFLELVAGLKEPPVTYQDLNDLLIPFVGQNLPLYVLRKKTMEMIEKITGRPLLCYVAKLFNVHPNLPAGIEDSDVTGFRDLLRRANTTSADVLIESNGGDPDTTARIVELLRSQFNDIRFIIPSNAFSAATLMSFSGNEIIMEASGSLGPIDPQFPIDPKLGNVPARAIQRGFEAAEKKLKEDSGALAAYLPLISQYTLHLLELCDSAQEQSKELARNWLKTYMLTERRDRRKVTKIVNFFSDFDLHKSHSKSISRDTAREEGLRVSDTEDTEGLSDLVCSLHTQYEAWFNTTPFFKMYENSKDVHWGKQAIQMISPQMMPPQMIPPQQIPPSQPQ